MSRARAAGVDGFIYAGADRIATLEELLRRIDAALPGEAVVRTQVELPLEDGKTLALLHQRGRVFLVDAFHGQQELADSVNHLLVVGFYLINVGYVAFALKSTENPSSLRQAIELVSDKLGLVLLVLGGMHFFNLFVFSRIRRHSRNSRLPVSLQPPVAPDAVLNLAVSR